jgi:hypothetical protein
MAEPFAEAARYWIPALRPTAQLCGAATLYSIASTLKRR